MKFLYWWIGNIYRLFTGIVYQKKISFDKASSIFGASFSKNNGWNHLINTFEEYDNNNDINFKDTSMYIFLKNFKPESISQLADIQNVQTYLPLFVYPWGTFKKNQNTSDKNQKESRFCGPSSDIFIKDEFERTIKLYNKLKKEGYHPWLNYNRHIGGTFLINSLGESRFIVLQGNHRMAILSHLGKLKKISVRNITGYKFIINEKNIHEWSLVKSKKCSKKDAINILNFFFRNDGTHLKNILKNSNTIN